MKTGEMLTAFILLSLLLYMGCENDNFPLDYQIKSIQTDKKSLSLEVGQHEQIKASTVPSVAVSPVFNWASADEEIAVVSDHGMVEAISEGLTFVTVSYQDIHVSIPIKVVASGTGSAAVLYDQILNDSFPAPELLVQNAGHYTSEGLYITGKGQVAKLDKFYALAERMVQYRLLFSSDAKAVFKSSEGDFQAYIDVAKKKMIIATNPVLEKPVEFLKSNREYLVEIYHIYQQAIIRIVDVKTGEAAELSATHNGRGGCGKGAVQQGFNVGMQWDKYCFGLSDGSFMLVKSITVFSLKSKVKLLIYGDSISQPEGYFPTGDFPHSWTQLIIDKLKGNAMSSGRGGGTIDMLLDYIRNELPFIKSEYVMVTIGTNGGNSADKLFQLVNYIRAQGSIPILNNIPCNESGTQMEINRVIDKVRRELSVEGCRFDLATSVNGDGKEVDKSMMYWEDYSDSYGWQIYHHPNKKGSFEMFKSTMEDIPDIYK